MVLRIQLLVLALALTLAPAAGAHELGKIQVYATFLKDGTYRVELVVDEDHLTPQDEGGPAGETRYGPIQGLTGEVDRRFGRLFRSLVDGATIAFDGRPVQPRAEMVPPDPGALPGRMTLRLHGPIPGGARTFTWSESAPIGSYPLIPQNEGEESAVWQWLEGEATSQPTSVLLKLR